MTRRSIVTGDGKRKCAKEQVYKSLEEFSFRTVNGRRYYMTICRSCNQERCKNYRLVTGLFKRLA